MFIILLLCLIIEITGDKDWCVFRSCLGDVLTTEGFNFEIILCFDFSILKSWFSKVWSFWSLSSPLKPFKILKYQSFLDLINLSRLKTIRFIEADWCIFWTLWLIILWLLNIILSHANKSLILFTLIPWHIFVMLLQVNIAMAFSKLVTYNYCRFPWRKVIKWFAYLVMLWCKQITRYTSKLFNCFYNQCDLSRWDFIIFCANHDFLSLVTCSIFVLLLTKLSIFE